MEQAADGLWLVTGTDNKWVVVADGQEVILVDADFPRDLPRVLAWLERIGRAPGDVTAIVLTPLIPTTSAGPSGCELTTAFLVRLLDAEAAHAHGEVIEQVSELVRSGQSWR